MPGLVRIDFRAGRKKLVRFLPRLQLTHIPASQCEPAHSSDNRSHVDGKREPVDPAQLGLRAPSMVRAWQGFSPSPRNNARSIGVSGWLATVTWRRMLRLRMVEKSL